MFFDMKVCCVFLLESPHRGNSNENTQYTIFNMNKKNTLNYPKSAAMGFFPKGLKNEFETAVVNEPSVFEPLKFYCICGDVFGQNSLDLVQSSLVWSIPKPCKVVGAPQMTL